MECIEGVFDLLATQAKERGVELFYTIDPEVSDEVIGDVLRLRQVLLNLVSNAVKFSRHGFVFVRCLPAHKAPEPPSSLPIEESASLALVPFPVSNVPTGLPLCFQVEDDGIGIPVDKISELFVPFSQV
jgi:signal transduction histidine kinase